VSRITPVIIFSSASVAVPGSMTVLGAWVATGWGLLQRRDLNPRLVRIRAPFHRRCRNAWALAEQLLKIPARRQVDLRFRDLERLTADADRSPNRLSADQDGREPEPSAGSQSMTPTTRSTARICANEGRTVRAVLAGVAPTGLAFQVKQTIWLLFELSLCLVDHAEPALIPKTSLKSDQTCTEVVRAKRFRASWR